MIPPPAGGSAATSKQEAFGTAEFGLPVTLLINAKPWLRHGRSPRRGGMIPPPAAGGVSRMVMILLLNKRLSWRLNTAMAVDRFATSIGQGPQYAGLPQVVG